jgi:hypothetical protein
MYIVGEHQVRNEKRSGNLNEAKFELLRSGQDYISELNRIMDNEYHQRYQSIVSGIKDLAKSGRVQAGWIVHLESLPIPFLSDAPLVDGQ